VILASSNENVEAEAGNSQYSLLEFAIEPLQTEVRNCKHDVFSAETLP
jgi:hypothetical protein